MTMPARDSAVVYCEGAFKTPNGKTAHGLVRRTSRYRVLSVIDSRYQGRDAGEVLDNRPCGIPIFGNLNTAIAQSGKNDGGASHMVIGLAPDGGKLGAAAREAVILALEAKLNVDSGLHDFLSEDPELAALARKQGVQIRDIRKPPPRDRLHFFSGKIGQVEAFKIALLGTDSAVGKRTTAWVLVDALRSAGFNAELIGTGQTAWLQGVRYGIVLDSIVNDFVAGEIEHAVWSCWNDLKPDVIVLEGQGSLMNPAYPGGMELLAAGRPDVVVLQHAPGRKDYDGFPGFPIQPLERQIQAVNVLSDKPVVAITINPEGLSPAEADEVMVQIRKSIGVPVVNVLEKGAGDIVEHLSDRLTKRAGV